MDLSKRLSCEIGSFSHCPNPHKFLKPKVLMLLISLCWNPGLHNLSRSPVVPPGLSVHKRSKSCPSASTSPAQSASHHLATCPCQAAISVPPTSLDECFFFNSFVVELPCSCDLLEVLVFFIFKLVVTLLFVVQESETFLPTPPSWPKLKNFKKI